MSYDRSESGNIYECESGNIYECESGYEYEYNERVESDCLYTLIYKLFLEDDSWIFWIWVVIIESIAVFVSCLILQSLQMTTDTYIDYVKLNLSVVLLNVSIIYVIWILLYIIQVAKKYSSFNNSST